MRKVAAALIVIFLAFFSFFGPMLAPYSADHTVTMTEYEGEMLFSPFAPNKAHPLGTDIWGYDMLTRILHGFRYTVGAVLAFAGGRVLLGFLLGTTLAFRAPARKIPRAPIVVPAFILIYFTVFRVSIGSSLSVPRLILLQGALIVLVGLPGVVASFSEDVRELLSRDFSEAARSVGAGRVRMLFVHILPHMTGRTVQRFVGEAVSVLVVLGQLAMFNVFLGGADVQLSPVLYFSRTNELAGMVGEYRAYLTSNQWLLLAPLGAYLSVLVSFFALSRIVKGATRMKRGRYV
jgi:peptide/nickel transport system permease protein